MVFGPVVHYLNSLDAVNTSNQRIRDIMNGASKEKLPPSGVFLWVDVRDIADAHVLAMEKAEAGNKRFFVTTGYFSNRQIAEIVADNFPEYKDNVPKGEALKSGDFPEGGPEKAVKYDNSRVKEVLGLKFRGLKECVVDTVKSLQAVE
jgi:nucleoside-diphosphate-sugar epimerase